MDISKYKSNPKKEQEGVWVEVGDASFKIARMNNIAYRKLLAEKMKPHRAAVQANNLDMDVLIKIMAETVAETIILDWKNLTDDGVPVPYSKEKVIELMTNDAYKDLGEFLMKLAEDRNRFTDDQEQNDLKKQ